MSFKNGNPRNHVVFDDSELSAMRKYAKDILMTSKRGNCPEYEVGKLVSILNLGGETVENYIDELVR